MQEQGFPGFEATTWYGLVGPGKLPTAIAEKVNRDVNTVLAQPDVQEKLDTYGAEDGGGSREKFQKFIADRARQVGQGGQGRQGQDRQLIVGAGSRAAGPILSRRRADPFLAGLLGSARSAPRSAVARSVDPASVGPASFARRRRRASYRGCVLPR